MTFPTDDPRANAAIRKTLPLLREATRRLKGILHDEIMIEAIPLEVEAEIDFAVQAIAKAQRLLAAEFCQFPGNKDASSEKPAKTRLATMGGALSHKPTRQQGQFLAFIREFVQHNYAGVAPTHAEFQKFFNLTPPSVNSMLKRLEQLGFIRRMPGKARAIELTIDPDLIPPLERPFKF